MWLWVSHDMVGANAPTPPYGGGLPPPTPPIMVGASAPTPPYGGGLAPPTPPLMVGANAPTPPESRPVGLPNVDW